MGIIVVAGGTGGVGRAIVQAIAATEKHTVKILSRKANEELSLELGVSINPVDSYEDVDKLVKFLEDNNVDTVISALSTDGIKGTSPEIYVIRAAEASKSTRRIVLSNWGMPVEDKAVQNFDSSMVKLKNLEEVRKTSLEYTSFYIGFMLDFYAFPAHKTFMKPATFFIDTEHSMAAVPGTGNMPITFTHTFDAAKFVSRALDLPKWEETGYFMESGTVTFNQLVKTVEETRGTKFKIVHDKIEDLKNGKATELPAVTKIAPFLPFPKEVLIQYAALFGVFFETGIFNFTKKKLLNNEFPDVKTLSIREAVTPVSA